MCWGIASSAARESSRGSAPPDSCSRHAAPTIAGVTRASLAVLLTGNVLPRPRGASSATDRNGPPIDWPAVTTNSPADAPPTSAKTPRREIVAGSGTGGASPPGS